MNVYSRPIDNSQHARGAAQVHQLAATIQAAHEDMRQWKREVFRLQDENAQLRANVRALREQLAMPTEKRPQRADVATPLEHSAAGDAEPIDVDRL